MNFFVLTAIERNITIGSFEIAVEKVLLHEGGYTPGLNGDSGGETNFGISKRAYSQLDIRNLTQQEAIAIYKRDYWRFDSVEDQQLANCLLDAAVNQGLGFALTNWHPHTTLKDFQVARFVRYAGVVARTPADATFMHSWAQRTLDV